MEKITFWEKALLRMAAVFLGVVLFLPANVFSQEETASAIRRYKGRESSTGYYEDYEVRQRGKKPRGIIREVSRDIIGLSPSAAKVRVRSHLVDSHMGIKFYQNLKCVDCHIREKHNIHTVRANLTCRQCHGDEPIASINHYFSPLNPLRKHAYVCAKCHEGASASFSSYVNHPPPPSTITAQKNFPILFYVFWFMITIAVGTFAVFIPHTILWGVREFLSKYQKDKTNGKN